MDDIGWLLQITWTCGTRESRGKRKHSITPDEAWTFSNPTCGTGTRLVDLYSSYVGDFDLFCLFTVVSICFLPEIYDR